MIKKYNVLALIPARGGSKRLPDKNIKELIDKPLIAYAIDEAKKSAYIDRIVTSTDSQKIADVAKSLGSETPFLRPDEFAQDMSTDYEAFLHALEWFRDNEDYVPDIVVQLRPTSPLRVVGEIDAAIELLANHPEADSVRTVAQPDQSPYKMYSINETGMLKPLLTIEGKSESFNMPQQKLPVAYKHVGYVDVIWSKTILEKKQMTGKNIMPLVLEEAYSGINTLQDWEYCEFLLKLREGKK